MDLRESPTGDVVRHPWETCRLRFFARILDKTHKTSGALRILDAGAGDGWFASTLMLRLPEGSSIVCFDTNYTAPQLAQLSRTASAGVTFTTVLPEQKFDIVLALDVVEHVEDDAGFLRRLLDTHLTDGGHLIFSVPAWPVLFSNHDRFLHHYRRYRPATARRLLKQIDLQILTTGGLFHGPMFVRAIQTFVEKSVHSKPAHDFSTVWRHGPLVTALVTFALSVDTALSRVAAFAGVELPGLSWWASCQKHP